MWIFDIAFIAVGAYFAYVLVDVVKGFKDLKI